VNACGEHVIPENILYFKVVLIEARISDFRKGSVQVIIPYLNQLESFYGT